MKELIRQWKVLLSTAKGDIKTYPTKQARVTLADFLSCLEETKNVLSQVGELELIVSDEFENLMKEACPGIEFVDATPFDVNGVQGVPGIVEAIAKADEQLKDLGQEIAEAQNDLISDNLIPDEPKKKPDMRFKKNKHLKE
jgi:hypothetical protein